MSAMPAIFSRIGKTIASVAKHWKAILAIAGALIVAIAVTVALDALFTTNPAHNWSTAVQATATLVLVGVTGIYVWITYRQMQLQATPLVAIRLAAQEQAAKQAIGMIQRTRDQINQLIREMPDLDQHHRPDLTRAIANASDLQDLANELYILAPSLPLQFAFRTIEACTEAVPASTYIYMLSAACATEATEALKAQRNWTLDGARRIYLADIRKPGSHHPEWDDLIAFRPQTKAEEALGTLQGAISAYLLASPKNVT